MNQLGNVDHFGEDSRTCKPLSARHEAKKHLLSASAFSERLAPRNLDHCTSLMDQLPFDFANWKTMRSVVLCGLPFLGV
jgi:hypothetical protein